MVLNNFSGNTPDAHSNEHSFKRCSKQNTEILKSMSTLLTTMASQLQNQNKNSLVVTPEISPRYR